MSAPRYFTWFAIPFVDGGEIPDNWAPVGIPASVGGMYWSVLCEWVGEGEPIKPLWEGV